MGRVLRLPFLFIPNNVVIPILTGPLQGKKWIVGSHNDSAWLGTYERNQSLTFAEKCKGCKVLWDLGAHAGYYTLLFKTINKESKVYSFEPVESNFQFFQKHVSLNNLHGIKLFRKAVSSKEGILKFAKGNSVGGKLSESGDMEVSVVRLSTLLKKNSIEIPDIIKMDIEGAEFEVLEDIERDLLSINSKPIIFLSTHGEEVRDKCLYLLQSVGYKITPLDDKKMNVAREFLLEPKLDN